LNLRSFGNIKKDREKETNDPSFCEELICTMTESAFRRYRLIGQKNQSKQRYIEILTYNISV